MRERGPGGERATTKRVLMVITPRMPGDLQSAARSAAAVAREARGCLRLITVRPIPPPRVDRYDRVIADEEREMARLAAAAEEQMAALHPELGDVPVERVVRFGRLAPELRIEAQAFSADLIGLVAPRRPRLRHQLRAWYLGRSLPAPVVLLPFPPEGADDHHRQSVVLPAFR